ncbi:MAG TPA: OmpH family outer membrane protein [Cyclobacteriaceae bacterium]|nr:OmpH family outer membrane protein [Cytophagales bacterium]HRF35240.1 OmpH family outer membrane protein [Cyclobacteriaceae bacterium]
MKNVSLALNGILVVAVAVLYYLHFSSGSKSTATSADSTVPTDIKIAYINSDTVLKYYDFFKTNVEKLEAKGKKLDQDLQNRAQSLQNDITAYQRNYGSMTIGQAKALEEDLGKKRQNLELYQRSLEQELMEEQAKVNEELYLKVTDYLKGYAEGKELQVVLKYNTSSDLLYGGSGIDITQDVIKGLNDLYKQELTAPKTKADSTKTKK